MEARKLNPAGYDIITCRPLFGWSALADHTVPKDHKNLITQSIMQRMVWSLSEGGILLAQLPMYEDHTSWFEALQEVDGVEVRGDIFRSQKGYHRSVVQIEKSAAGKILLPSITEVKYFPKPKYKFLSDGTFVSGTK